jgi:hypothetical protein
VPQAKSGEGHAAQRPGPRSFYKGSARRQTPPGYRLTPDSAVDATRLVLLLASRASLGSAGEGSPQNGPAARPPRRATSARQIPSPSRSRAGPSATGRSVVLSTCYSLGSRAVITGYASRLWPTAHDRCPAVNTAFQTGCAGQSLSGAAAPATPRRLADRSCRRGARGGIRSRSAHPGRCQIQSDRLSYDINSPTRQHSPRLADSLTDGNSESLPRTLTPEDVTSEIRIGLDGVGHGEAKPLELRKRPTRAAQIERPLGERQFGRNARWCSNQRQR